MGRGREKELFTNEMNKVVQFVLEGSFVGKTGEGRLGEAAQRFSIHRQMGWRLWGAAKKQKERGDVIHIFSDKKIRKTKKVLTLDIELLKSIDLGTRRTLESLAFALKVSPSTAQRWVSSGQIRNHTSALKPDLTMPNKLLRMRFSLEQLELDTILNKLKFKYMYNTVHIDEKWFYITRGSRRFYLAPDEEDPHRTCKNKKFICKVMFMCAVGKPLFSPTGEVLFDGKLGIFPFTIKEPAKRRSKHRPTGTLVTKPIDSINKKVIKECIINKVLPAIMDKWPAGASKDIFIQQDNARPHIKDSDVEFRAAATQNGFNIHLVQQPPNNPDCNVNDLGWFRAIQSLQIKTASKTVDDLLNAVMKSFDELSPIKLNNVFLSLQGCMIEILKVKGQNCYKTPHMGKWALIRSDMLPISLHIPSELAADCIKYLQEMGVTDGILEIGQKLQIEGY